MWEHSAVGMTVSHAPESMVTSISTQPSSSPLPCGLRLKLDGSLRHSGVNVLARIGPLPSSSNLTFWMILPDRCVRDWPLTTLLIILFFRVVAEELKGQPIEHRHPLVPQHLPVFECPGMTTNISCLRMLQG